MTIRKKITVWYSAFLFVLMSVCLTIILFTVEHFMHSDSTNLIQQYAEKISAAVTIKEDKLVFEQSQSPIAPGCNFAIFYPSGEIYFDNTGWADVSTEPAKFGKVIEIDIGDSEWLLLDRQIKNNNEVIGRLRVILPTSRIEKTIEDMGIIFIFATLAFIAVVVVGSLYIAGAALAPIDAVTNTARQISTRDLSKRIDIIHTEDEVGRLIKTFNAMLERLESAFKRERQFSSDASHELRTPLSVAMANTEEALHSQKTIPEYIETLEQIDSQCGKMNKIITQLLTLTRGYDGKFLVSKERFNIETVVKGIISEMKDFADGYGVTICYDQKENIMVYADHMLMTQMLINLISNACKYGKVGGVVTITTVIIDNMTSITILDNGVGISDDDIGHIFERFYRADKSHTGDGSGLGLSIVKWIVEAHFGSIEVKSKLGEGTSIQIKIPLEI